MSMVHRLGSRLTTTWLAIAALAMWTAPASAEISIEQARKHEKESVVFTVDVAEDFALFVPTLVKPTDTQPERGSFFVTEGNIYPAGTIKGDGAAFDPHSGGSMGRWFCRGSGRVDLGNRTVDQAQD